MHSAESPALLFIFAALVVGIIVIAARFLSESMRYARMPRDRVYLEPNDKVRAFAESAVASLGYVITFVDDQSVSFMRPYMGWAPMAPVVHAVILPIDKEITRLEVIGQRNEYQYNWHVMAQTFLTQMDAWLKRKT